MDEHQESEELTRGDTKDALIRIEHHLVLSQDAKHFFQMGDVIYNLEAFNEHVIYVDLHSFSDQFSKYFVHQSLVCCPRIFQTKMHDFIAIKFPLDNK